MLRVGESPQRLQDSKIGVFVGQMTGDAVVCVSQDTESTGFEAVGTARAMMANRLSNFFGFTGWFVLLGQRHVYNFVYTLNLGTLEFYAWRQRGVRSLPRAPTNGQCWESNPRPCQST